MRKAPRNMPGNRPARKTPIGNLLHWDVVSDADAPAPVNVDVELVRVAEAVEVADVVVEAVAEELLVFPDEPSVFPTMLVSLIMVHSDPPSLFTTQAYPNGQQLFPQVGSLSPSLVVKIPLDFPAVAF